MSQARYNLQVRDFMAKTGIGLTTIVKRLAFGIHGRVVKKTPVDSGRLRASWNLIEGDDPDLDVPPESDFTSAGEDSSKRSANEEKADSVAAAKRRSASASVALAYTVSSNLPYAEVIENGGSDQAPNGMMKLSIAEENAEFIDAMERLS